LGQPGQQVQGDAIGPRPPAGSALDGPDRRVGWGFWLGWGWWLVPALDRAFASELPYLVNVVANPAGQYPRSSNLG